MHRTSLHIDCTNMHSHVFTQMHKLTFMNAYQHIHNILSHIQTHSHNHTHSHTHVYTHTYTHSHVYTLAQICTLAYTCPHTQTHTHARTHAHTTRHPELKVSVWRRSYHLCDDSSSKPFSSAPHVSAGGALPLSGKGSCGLFNFSAAQGGRIVFLVV